MATPKLPEPAANSTGPTPKPETTDSSRTNRVSPGRLALYGLTTLAVTALGTWGLAELSTPPGEAVLTADLSNLGRTVGLIAAAAVGVPGAVLAFHRQRALDTANQVAMDQHEHKVRSDDREHRSSTERHLRERYTTCAEQLGHDNFAVRLAGVYALASLADDWHEFGNDSERQVCIDLLCAYLRTQREPSAGDTTSIEERERHRNEEQQVRAAIVSLIRVRTMQRQWDDCQFDLSNAILVRAELYEADLSGANLIGAKLAGADLAETRLIATDLLGAILTEANLTGANLFDANLKGADLFDANLKGADLIDADLKGANLKGADLTGADLTGADLTGADLTGANLTGANLTGANLTGVVAPETTGTV